jgi:LysM repeat protein
LKLYSVEGTSSIETKNGVTLNGTKKQQITGQTLSAVDVEKLGTNKYIVIKGDNLSIIAKKNNIKVSKLVQLNRLSIDQALTPGQILVVK